MKADADRSLLLAGLGLTDTSPGSAGEDRSSRGGNPSERPSEPEDRFFTRRQVSAKYPLGYGWLAKAAMTGTGPPYIKIGGKVLYSESAFLAWLAAHQRQSTAKRSREV